MPRVLRSGGEGLVLGIGDGGTGLTGVLETWRLALWGWPGVLETGDGDRGVPRGAG